jgi:micrococcal nuclease
MLPAMAKRYRTGSNVARFRPRPRRRTRTSRRGLTPILIVAPLAAFTAVFLWDGAPPGFSMEIGAPSPTARDRESARFTRCAGSVRDNCVVDGDTFWYRGEKVRIADINAPEVSRPDCRREAELGEQATRRLQALLNAGPFTLARDPLEPDRDRYDRLLRDVTRDGESLGDTLRAAGLAERWKGYRGDWC